MLSFMARDSWSSQASVCPLQVQQPAAGTAGTLPQAPPPPCWQQCPGQALGLDRSWLSAAVLALHC